MSLISSLKREILCNFCRSYCSTMTRQLSFWQLGSQICKSIHFGSKYLSDACLSRSLLFTAKPSGGADHPLWIDQSPRQETTYHTCANPKSRCSTCVPSLKGAHYYQLPSYTFFAVIRDVQPLQGIRRVLFTSSVVLPTVPQRLQYPCCHAAYYCQWKVSRQSVKDWCSSGKWEIISNPGVSKWQQGRG